MHFRLFISVKVYITRFITTFVHSPNLSPLPSTSVSPLHTLRVRSAATPTNIFIADPTRRVPEHLRRAILVVPLPARQPTPISPIQGQPAPFSLAGALVPAVAVFAAVVAHGAAACMWVFQAQRLLEGMGALREGLVFGVHVAGGHIGGGGRGESCAEEDEDGSELHSEGDSVEECEKIW
jgi:hypothetical protein